MLIIGGSVGLFRIKKEAECRKHQKKTNSKPTIESGRRLRSQSCDVRAIPSCSISLIPTKPKYRKERAAKVNDPPIKHKEGPPDDSENVSEPERVILVQNKLIDLHEKHFYQSLELFNLKRISEEKDKKILALETEIDDMKKRALSVNLIDFGDTPNKQPTIATKANANSAANSTNVNTHFADISNLHLNHLSNDMVGECNATTMVDEVSGSIPFKINVSGPIPYFCIIIFLICSIIFEGQNACICKWSVPQGIYSSVAEVI